MTLDGTVFVVAATSVSDAGNSPTTRRARICSSLLPAEHGHVVRVKREGDVDRGFASAPPHRAGAAA
jgi:hypothetical protein